MRCGESVRQGDVLVTRVARLPKGTGAVPEAVPGRHVLALGEATGHHHSVAVADAELLESKAGEVFLRIMRATPLEHQEHAAILLEPGTYRVTRQREYAAPQIERRVAD